jgi:hypothetical protein
MRSNVFTLPVSGANKTHSPAPHGGTQQSQQFVVTSTKAVWDMTDTELQQRIQFCAEQFMAAQREWEQTGDFAAVGTRDYWWQAESEALRERGSRPQVVAQMEAERGLA